MVIVPPRDPIVCLLLFFSFFLVHIVRHSAGAQTNKAFHANSLPPLVNAALNYLWPTINVSCSSLVAATVDGFRSNNSDAIKMRALTSDDHILSSSSSLYRNEFFLFSHFRMLELWDLIYFICFYTLLRSLSQSVGSTHSVGRSLARSSGTERSQRL